VFLSWAQRATSIALAVTCIAGSARSAAAQAQSAAQPASRPTAQPAGQPPAQPGSRFPAPGRPNPADPATWTSGLAKDHKPQPGVDFKVLSFMSEGVRLHGELFTPSSKKGEKLPTVVMAHGWGGIAARLRAEAEQIALAGLQVFTFDYRGWGESGSRVILVKPSSEPKPPPPGRKFTAEVEMIRGYIDPWEQAEDWFNAINFIVAEPTVDAARIGIRGSSYSGGLVLYVAAHDDRVKALVSQVGGIAARPTPGKEPKPGTPGYEFWVRRHEAGVRMARGELGYPEPGAIAFGSLIGTPVGNKLSRWWPNEAARDVTAPALFVLAEQEELVDNKTNGILAHKRVRGPKKLVIVPGIKHYGIYREARTQAVDLAIDWFRKYLK
jgi:dienelactone hydrolase